MPIKYIFDWKGYSGKGAEVIWILWYTCTLCTPSYFESIFFFCHYCATHRLLLHLYRDQTPQHFFELVQEMVLQSRTDPHPVSLLFHVRWSWLFLRQLLPKRWVSDVEDTKFYPVNSSVRDSQGNSIYLVLTMWSVCVQYVRLLT